jgi:hypothetical protein
MGIIRQFMIDDKVRAKEAYERSHLIAFQIGSFL